MSKCMKKRRGGGKRKERIELHVIYGIYLYKYSFYKYTIHIRKIYLAEYI
jgi:hypothetical protein